MNHATRCTAAAVLCAALLAPFAASAQDEAASPFSWNVTAVSDYVFRGVSQTDEDPTSQAGFTYTSPVGLYAGVWGSGVDFGDGGPDAEVDYLIGYAFDVTDNVNLDLLLNRYTYPGSSGSSVYVYDQSSKQRMITGVNVAESAQSNLAVRLNATYIAWINGLWK
jgi:uncharacterized protein (TIGR02001 family)